VAVTPFIPSRLMDLSLVINQLISSRERIFSNAITSPKSAFEGSLSSMCEVVALKICFPCKGFMLASLHRTDIFLLSDKRWDCRPVSQIT
jgi:hypothetical protein